MVYRFTGGGLSCYSTEFDVSFGMLTVCNLTLSITHVTQTAQAYPIPHPVQLLTPPETASNRCQCLLSHIKIVALLLEMLHVFLRLVSQQLCL